MARYHLYTRAVLRVSGEDARKLLNDTLTCRFDAGLRGAGRWFALLSPQGKVQVEGLVTENDQGFWFDIEAGLVADFLKRMKLYRLRAKVEIQNEPALAVWWSPDGDGPRDATTIAYSDSRAPGLGTRYLIASDNNRPDGPTTGDALSAYNTLRIAGGVAEFGADFGLNEVFPHDIGMDFLGGVDFKKGCYIGQEVVSRMQHRGTARRRPVIVSGLPEMAAVGAPVLVGEREAGPIGAIAGGKAVGILRLDRITDQPATVAGVPVKLTLPEWASYRFGAPAEAE